MLGVLLRSFVILICLLFLFPEGCLDAILIIVMALACHIHIALGGILLLIILLKTDINVIRGFVFLLISFAIDSVTQSFLRKN